MAYNEVLANRIREALIDIPNVEEKKMFSGITFMVNNKMCIGVAHDELMCRVGPEMHDIAAEMQGVREMIHGGRVAKGFVFVTPDAHKTQKQFDEWIRLCLDYNPNAKETKKKKNTNY
jgi:TfoX/Sxy family transcriptional regulator of competence genes